MSSFVYMKILESSPARYDRGMQIHSRGRILELYELVASHVATPEVHILDVGCGTGGVSLACASRGASVVGMDINAGMVEIARQKSSKVDYGHKIEWIIRGAIEIEDIYTSSIFNAVVFCLVMSEMSPAEQVYLLETVHKVLLPGGKLVIADEIFPPANPARFIHRLRRIPLAMVTFVLTQTTTRPLKPMDALLLTAGFQNIRTIKPWGDWITVITAEKPEQTHAY
jgi:demethylmenaquinone methyltransferase/2-methoxy-6-polyprenyl-1,4-benzoquinol methylase